MSAADTKPDGPVDGAAAAGPGSEVAARGDAYRWRQFATMLSFGVFGLAGLAFGFVVVPLLGLRHRDPARRGVAVRRALRHVMRGLLATMHGLRVLDWRVEGDPRVARGTMVIANHPSLIDAVLLLSVLEEAHCIVKDSLTDNPFLGRAIEGLGYPDNRDAGDMIDRCVSLVRDGGVLLVFPEATRTPAGAVLGPLHRGAAYIAVRAGCPIHPVTIRVSEPTLTKGAPWWRVPARRPRFVLRFHAPWPPESTAGAAAGGARARALNRRWEAFFNEEFGRANPP